VRHDFVIAGAGTRAGFVDEDGNAWYCQVVGWIQNELETGEVVFRPIACDREFTFEAAPLEDSRCLVRICFDGENLNGAEIDNHAKSLQAELKRDAEFSERERVVRRQVGKALLASHPAPLSKSELIAGGIVDEGKMLPPILGVLKNGGLIEELPAGKYCLTARGVEQAKASADGRSTNAS
jgi:hypothetical protein